MRLLAGLEPIDEGVRLMGIGGPDFTAQDPLYTLDAGLATDVGETRRTLDELLRQTELQRYSYLEVLENLEQQRDHWARIPSISPVAEGRITSGYGRRLDPFTKRRALHRGVDISARRGAPIVATADGKVIFAKKNYNYGLTVKIDHGNGIVTLYAHILDIKVKRGDRVKRGQEIARVGSTGRATAPHVHYEVRVDGRTANPRQYMLDEHFALN
jgi:murein DD-endopeptidase MepM/ murein hydrolase activator NlpD